MKTVDDENLPLAETEALVTDGKLLQAYARTQEPGLPPLRDWQGPRAQTLAGRLHQMLGNSRRGGAIHWINGRENPDDARVFLYYCFEHFSRSSPLRTFSLIDAFLARTNGQSHKASEIADLLAFKGYILAVYRDFHVADRLLTEAEALDPLSAL